MEEIAKLPSGVAVVYQNNWISPVLTLIHKANVTEEAYQPGVLPVIRTAKTARNKIVRMLMQPWISGNPIDRTTLEESLKVLDLTRGTRKKISHLIDDYIVFGGHLIWKQERLAELQDLLKEVLGISNTTLGNISSPGELRQMVGTKVAGLNAKNIEEICFLLSSTEEVMK